MADIRNTAPLDPGNTSGGVTVPGDARRLPTIAMVAANLVPLYGVLFHGWSIFFIMLSYWMENVVVGFYNVLRMVWAQGNVLPAVDETKLTEEQRAAYAKASSLGLAGKGAKIAIKVFAIPFFIVHYGLFTFVHGVFVVVLFGGVLAGQPMEGSPVDMLHRALAGGQGMSVLWVFIALMISHGISYWLTYIVDGEYRTATLPALMGRPYGRIVVLHLTILLGGFAVVALGSGLLPLVLLTLLKIGTDLGLARGRFRVQFGTTGSGESV